MTDTTQHDSGWIDCRRCKGTGTFSWAEGQSGPCFLCNGTGDGRIRNFAGFGPRRGGQYHNKRKGNGHALPPVLLTESPPRLIIPVTHPAHCSRPQSARGARGQ